MSDADAIKLPPSPFAKIGANLGKFGGNAWAFMKESPAMSIAVCLAPLTPIEALAACTFFSFRLHATEIDLPCKEIGSTLFMAAAVLGGVTWWVDDDNAKTSAFTQAANSALAQLANSNVGSATGREPYKALTYLNWHKKPREATVQMTVTARSGLYFEARSSVDGSVQRYFTQPSPPAGYENAQPVLPAGPSQ